METAARRTATGAVCVHPPDTHTHTRARASIAQKALLHSTANSDKDKRS